MPYNFVEESSLHMLPRWPADGKFKKGFCIAHTTATERKGSI